MVTVSKTSLSRYSDNYDHKRFYPQQLLFVFASAKYFQKSLVECLNVWVHYVTFVVTLITEARGAQFRHLVTANGLLA
jgi:hypothetical protein